jgi:inorganic phosphate transporter, PiT family
LDEQVPLSPTEKLWTGFCWVTASFKSLAHGGNDVANSVGPFAAVLAASGGNTSKEADVPFWVFIVAGFGICIGLAMYGHKVMETIGKNLTKLQPSKAFAAELSSTFVILLATRLGIPISTTHASVGAVMGVGMADDGWRKGLNWKELCKVYAQLFPL